MMKKISLEYKIIGALVIFFGLNIYLTYKRSAYKKCQDRNAKSGGNEDCTKFSAILEN